jgi:gliding motility-associated-like protein
VFVNRDYFKLLSSVCVFWVLLFPFLTLNAQSQSSIELTANPSQLYCPQSEQPIVTNFSIKGNIEMAVLALYIQISSGFTQNRDVLILSKDFDNIRASWNTFEAKLTLSSINGSALSSKALEEAVKSVVFYSTDPNPINDKYISITIGDANYLPNSGHYYEFVNAPNITWTDAKIAAESRTYYGQQGYLVTIQNQEEAILVGELSPGVGWIGGTDQEEEGVWKWAGGPEKDVIFWEGSQNGSTPNFAFWNNNEPNNLGNEDYAHITDNSVGVKGSWNDLPNKTNLSGSYQAKGYVVEYGGMPDDPQISFSTSTRLIMPQISEAIDVEGCENNPLKINITANIPEVKWYDSETGGELLFEGLSYTTQLSETTTFWLQAYPEDCSDNARTPIKVVIYPYPEILLPQLTIEQCDEDNSNDGISSFNLRGFESKLSRYYINETFEYFTSSDFSESSKILNPEKFQNTAFEQKIYVKITAPGNCFESSSILLKVSANLINTDFYQTFETCETDIKSEDLGIEGWDQSIFDSLRSEIIASDTKFQNQNINISFYDNENDAFLGGNAITFLTPSDLYFMKNPYLQTLWARIDNLNLNEITCLGIKEVALLKVNKLPEFERTDNQEIVCLNLDPIEIGVRSSDGRNYNYTWERNGIPFENNSEDNGASININDGGLYRVTATTTDGTDCSKFHEILLIRSEVAHISQDDLQVEDLVGDTGNITINTENLGSGDYEFAIGDPLGPYQDEAFFEGVYPGIKSLFIRDKNGCGLTEINVSLLGHMKFFSPNGDGINDYWQILGVDTFFQPNSKIYVYDRYGKLLVNLYPADRGWDGTYNGSPLPQNDYWFQVFFEDGRTHSGHFSLLRNP